MAPSVDCDKAALPPHGKRYDIFISHSSRRDPDFHELVDKLADALRRRGFSVFLDRTDLVKGQKIFESLYSAIKDSASGVVVLTKNSVASSWVHFELQEMEYERLAGKLCILVLRLEAGCSLPEGIKPDAIIDAPRPFDLTDLTERVAREVCKCLRARLGN